MLLLVLRARRIIDSRAGTTYCRSAMSISVGWEANKLPRFYGNRAPTCGWSSRDLWSQLLRIIRYLRFRNSAFAIAINSARYRFALYLFRALERPSVAGYRFSNPPITLSLMSSLSPSLSLVCYLFFLIFENRNN